MEAPGYAATTVTPRRPVFGMSWTTSEWSASAPPNSVSAMKTKTRVGRFRKILVSRIYCRRSIRTRSPLPTLLCSTSFTTTVPEGSPVTTAFFPSSLTSLTLRVRATPLTTM